MNKQHNTPSPLTLIKYGGNAMVNESLKKQIIKCICNLKEQGHRIVLVHGGGPFIQQMLNLANLESEFVSGHRKTSPEALTYVEMALKGQVNGSLVSIFNSLGHKAVGVSGKDGGLAIANKRTHQEKVGNEVIEHDLGQVGDIAEIDTSLLEILLHNGFIPVVTCLASDEQGIDYNINADMFAGNLAGALKADNYLVLTDVDGLMKDINDPSSLIRKIASDKIQELIEMSIIKGGMIPKLESCQIALQKGAAQARIINGTKPEQIVAASKNEAIGTLITS